MNETIKESLGDKLKRKIKKADKDRSEKRPPESNRLRTAEQWLMEFKNRPADPGWPDYVQVVITAKDIEDIQINVLKCAREQLGI